MLPTLKYATIETRELSAQKPLYACGQIGLGRLDDRMKMVSHQAVGLDLPTGLPAGLAQRFQKTPPVLVVQKDLILVIPTIHQVVEGSFIFQTLLAWHSKILKKPLKYVIIHL